jgi:hypothetical protein
MGALKTLRNGIEIKRSLAAVCLGIGLVVSGHGVALAASAIHVSLNAPVLATISVTTGTVTCAAGNLPCTSSTSVTGLIRSSRNQVSSIVVSDAALSPLQMTCADHSTGTMHGALTLAIDAILEPGADVKCASWGANPMGNVIAVDNTITFTSAAASALNFTVSLVVS